MMRCCLTTPDPGRWQAGVDNGADPEHTAVMHRIRDSLSYRMPIGDLIVALESSIQIDSRTELGGDIQRCLLSNAAERLTKFACKVEPMPWLTWRDRLRDAWAVFCRRAVVVYVSDKPMGWDDLWNNKRKLKGHA